MKTPTSKQKATLPSSQGGFSLITTPNIKCDIMATPNVEWTTAELNPLSGTDATCTYPYAEECLAEDRDEDSGPSDGPSGEDEAV